MLLFLLSLKGWSEETFQEACSEKLSLPSSLPGCPSFSAQGIAGKVSLQVAKTLDTPGVVCVRVINGLSQQIDYGVTAFQLQRWDEEEKTFRAVERPELRGTAVAPRASVLLEGQTLDRYLPRRGASAPAGRYRVCFRFGAQEWSGEQERCSEEFHLP
jgi:hypothetical protein